MKNKTLMFLFILLLSFFPVYSFSQDTSQIAFLSELDNKTTATYGDALTLFRFQTGAIVPKAGAAVPKKKAPVTAGNEIFMLSGYSESDTLTRGMAALMTAKYLDLGGSFMYLIFGTERYAYRACIANGIMISEGIISGPELLELFSKIDEYKGGE
jgi:hypothetical protein